MPSILQHPMPRTLPATPEEKEPLVDASDRRCQTQDVLLSTKEPDVTAKNSQHDTARKANTLEMLDYKMSVWTHVCTDGSSDAAVKRWERDPVAMAKRCQGRRLQVRCQATTGLNLLFCMKLADFSSQRHHPVLYRLPFRL